MLNQKNESWRPIIGYQGLYEVSSCGRVRTVERSMLKMNRHGYKSPFRLKSIIRPLCEKLSTTGKLCAMVVTLHKNGKPICHKVHHLVLQAFVGPCPLGHVGRHFPDRNPKNNCVTNLSWETRKQNAADMQIHKTDGAGERNSQAILTWDIVRQIRKLWASGKHRQCDLARRFGIRPGRVEHIVHHRQWIERRVKRAAKTEDE